MPDFLASMVVFTVILTVFLSSWNSVIQDQVKFRSEDEMQFRARHTTTFLVTTPGHPENWNSSNVQIPGLAEPDHVLQLSKLERFKALNYSTQRQLLKAHNFYLAVKNSSGVIELKGGKLEYGRNYTDADTVIPVRRTVELNSSDKIMNAELEYVVWR